MAWRKRRALASAVVLLGPLAAGCSGPAGPGSTAQAFVDAWDHGDAARLRALAEGHGAGLPAAVAAVSAGLGATSVTRTAGRPSTRGSIASVPVTSTYRVPGFGVWVGRGLLQMTRSSGTWLVRWGPGAVDASLAAGERLQLDHQWPPRAVILGAGGAALTGDGISVVVGVQGSRIKDPTQLATLLQSTGAAGPAVSAALARAAAAPNQFVPVVTLSDAAYRALGGDQSPLHDAPGTVFERVATRTAVTPGLSAHLVGSVGPATADELSRLGPPYAAGDVVGQNGVEASYERRLAGQPAESIVVVDSAGGVVRTLASVPGQPGTPVTTSVDPAVQQAAEKALSGVNGVAALVALRVSTGELLASVSLPAAAPFDAALEGRFPPGSTFKIVTSAALIGAGLGPQSPASCPSTTDGGGEIFHNAEGDHTVSDLSDAFTESCNTAFVQLALQHLSASSLTGAAGLFGIGSPTGLGLSAFAGSAPAPADQAALAATAIGQAQVVVSPLDMAVVAAAVASGSYRPARLVAGAPADTRPARALPAAVVAALRSMMSSVVARGTAAGVGLPAGTYAKTGTAQYGTGNPLPTDAWLVGWRNDVAFAIVVQNSKGNGGPVDGPLIARFLRALPAAYQQ